MSKQFTGLLGISLRSEKVGGQVGVKPNHQPLLPNCNVATSVQVPKYRNRVRTLRSKFQMSTFFHGRGYFQDFRYNLRKPVASTQVDMASLPNFSRSCVSAHLTYPRCLVIVLSSDDGHRITSHLRAEEPGHLKR